MNALDSVALTIGRLVIAGVAIYLLASTGAGLSDLVSEASRAIRERVRR